MASGETSKGTAPAPRFPLNNDLCDLKYFKSAKPLKSKASLDTLAKIITAIYFGIAAIPACFLISAAVSGDPLTDRGAHLSALVLLLVMGIAVWIFAPRYYKFNDKMIEVGRIAGNIKIPLRQISTVDELPRDQLRGMIRTFGVGGLFGYYGNFYSPSLGHLTMFATRSKGMVLITTTTGKKIVISPDDDTFAARLRGMLKTFAA